MARLIMNEPAFPRSMISLNGPFDSSAYSDGYGMDLRDYFAAKAMQGISTNLATLREPNWLAMAEDAYKMADAMMKAREA